MSGIDPGFAHLRAQRPRPASRRALALVTALAVTAVVVPTRSTEAQSRADAALRGRAVAAAQADARHAHHPPRTGRFIYGHWTAYTPPDPASLPAEARKHVVRKGDTLWDLSRTYYNDPLLWPALWDANSWVTFPHWIYPGDTLLVPPLMILPPGQVATRFELPPLSDVFTPAGGPAEARCGHFITPKGHQFRGEIIDTPVDPAPVMLIQGEAVFVNLGAKDGVLPGDEFSIVYPSDHFDYSVTASESHRTQLVHPLSGEKLGVVQRMAGRLRIILLGEAVSTAEIIEACDAIEIGYDLHPVEEIPMPLVRRHERDKYVNEVPERGRGFIVYLTDGIAAAGIGQLVSLDLGKQQGVIPGDTFTIYRNKPYDFLHQDTEMLGDFWDAKSGRRQMKRRADPAEGGYFLRSRRVPETPPRLIGEVVVLYTEATTSTAKISAATVEVMPGDLLVYRPFDAVAQGLAVLEAAPTSAAGH